METITKYKAKDGREFINAKNCSEHEKLLDKINGIMSVLPERPDDVDFSNGRLGYIQHTPETFYAVRHELLKLMQKQWKHDWIKQSIDDKTIHPSWVGRLVGDGIDSAFNSAWYRISCTNPDTLREYGQIYYANNPDEAQVVCINE